MNSSSSSGTPICLPRLLPYPLSIQRIHAANGTSVQKTSVLCTYSYVDKSSMNGERSVASWESPIEGVVTTWTVREGQRVGDADTPIVYIYEPCTHDVQLNGLCAICGKDLTEQDYTGFSDTTRADISMVHDVGGLKVSLGEAHRLETQTTQRLLTSRKLSLIVDLDQTIVHATVDPTVKEWLANPKNPNYEALKDVEKFRLGTNPDERTEDGCWYYVKMRPGLRTFLKRISDIYEMHVYTMGTRGYASEVCKIIDPDGSLFGGRILSRDESGSMTRKSLQRLFPCDTNMVVIIDDRADVWDGSPNLVKVIPYEFFVGIGDINAAFLPKKKDLTANPAAKTPPTAASSDASSPDSGKETSPDTSLSSETEVTSASGSTAASNESVLLQATSSTEASTPVPSLSEAEATNSLAIHAQIENRPLSKSTHKSKVTPSPSTSGSDSEAGSGNGITVGSEVEANELGEESESESDAELEDEDDEEEEEIVEAVLKDDDRELDRLESVLTRVHDSFFANMDDEIPADVRNIIPEMKQQVLQGVNLIFSGVIALGARPQDSEYWKLATAFGARCTTEMSSRLTHMVASQNNTAKVHQARSMRSVRVVWTQWLLDSAAHWHRQNESLYLISPDEEEAPKSPIVDPSVLLPESEEGNLNISNPPSPVPSDLDDGNLDITEVDWGDAAKEIDDFLNETDEDDLTDGELTDGSTVSNGVRKRRRIQTDSEDESSSSSSKAASVGEGSPLQKRVKTSRSRKSRLKVSFPADLVDSDPVEPPTIPPKSQPNGSGPPSPGGGDGYEASQASSSLDSDDDAFFASMAAEVEKGFTSDI